MIGKLVLAVVGIVIVLLLVPIGACLTYNEELLLCVRVLGIPVYRFSSSSSRTAVPNNAEKEPQKRLNTLAQRLQDNGVRTVLEESRALVRIAKKAAGRMLRAVIVDKLVLQITIASCDASTTAQDTGRMCAALYPTLTTLQSQVRIRQRRVTVEPDYLAETGRVRAEIRGHTMPIRIVWAALCAVLAYAGMRHRAKNTKEDSKHG